MQNNLLNWVLIIKI